MQAVWSEFMNLNSFVYAEQGVATSCSELASITEPSESFKLSEGSFLEIKCTSDNRRQ